MKSLAIVGAAALLLGATAPVSAASVTFGQFLQKQSGMRLFRYEKQDVGAVKAAEIYTTSSTASNAHGSIPIYFLLSNGGLPADLTGLQDAHLVVDFFSNSGTTGSGSSRVQAFDTLVAGTISITRDSAAAEGNGTRKNLLSVNFTNAELDATQNGGSFTFKTNSNSVVNYSSDFLDFTNTVVRDFSFSFSGANPTFSAALGNSSRNTRFSGTGTFASDPAPLTFGVPEASTWAMLVVGFGAVGAALRTGRRSKDLFAA